MRKIMKLMTITTIASISTFQVVACKDDSQYETFISDVNNSVKDKTAFFGFLGSADNEQSSSLNNIFTYLNNSIDEKNSIWQNWVNEHDKEIKAIGLTNIYLKTYQGPYHDPKPSDPIDSFWNDKSIKWQRNIFDWVYSRSNNEDSHLPQGVEEVTKIEPKKDNDDKDMFKNLPIVFIITEGRLITAGQNWIAPESSFESQKAAVEEFVLTNLFLPE